MTPGASSKWENVSLCCFRLCEAMLTHACSLHKHTHTHTHKLTKSCFSRCYLGSLGLWLGKDAISLPTVQQRLYCVNIPQFKNGKTETSQSFPRDEYPGQQQQAHTSIYESINIYIYIIKSIYIYVYLKMHSISSCKYKNLSVSKNL